MKTREQYQETPFVRYHFILIFIHIHNRFQNTSILPQSITSHHILHQMLNLIHIKLDMRVHLQILVMSRVDFVLDILLQVGHLQKEYPVSNRFPNK